MKTEIEKLEEITGYKFKRPEFLAEVFIHTSYKKEKNNIEFDRLEFIGDRILGCVVARYLYDTFPEEDTGTIVLKYINATKTTALSEAAQKLKIVEFIIALCESDSIIADTTEALIGAIFLDGSYTKAQTFILKRLFKDYEFCHDKNSKSILQEWAQKQGYKPPVYKTAENKNLFLTNVEVLDINLKAKGYGQSKKESSVEAAKNLLEKLEKI